MRAWLIVAFTLGLSACATSGKDCDTALAERLGADKYAMKSCVFVALKTDPAVAAGVFEAEMIGRYGSAALVQIPELHRRIQMTKVE